MDNTTETQSPGDIWHRLDNTGKIYPLIRSDWRTTLYRFTAVLHTPVDPERLKGALHRVFLEFPHFRVVLKPGFFWYFFEQTSGLPPVQPDEHYPCTHYERRLSVPPIHIYHKENLLSVEISHALTDGYGASEFLRSLLIHYFGLSHGMKTGDSGLPNPSSPERWEDSYTKHYDPSVPKLKRGPKAFHLPYKLVSPGIYFSTTGTIPLHTILQKAKSDGSTLTEWLTAFYISILAEMIQDLRWEPAPVSLNVPIDLRRLYHSDTVRNFFVTIMPSIDCRLGHFSFDEILFQVKNFMKLEVDKRYISQQFKRNVDMETNLAVRLIPLSIKRLIFPWLYYYFGERQYSGGLSNMGAFLLPDDIEDEVQEIHILPPPSQRTIIKAGCISYRDTFSITFGSLAQERELERRFFSGLRKEGIPVKLIVNY